MLNDKVLLTYKRKRLSYQTDAAHSTEGTSLSPNMQIRSSWMCCPKSECDANDEKLKNHHPGKCQLSTCISRCGFTESMQKHVPTTNGVMQSQITVLKDMGPMVLRSNRVLSSTQIDNISRMEASSTVHECGSNMKNIIPVDASGRKFGLDYTKSSEGSLTSILVHDQIGNPINLNVSLVTDEGDKSECPEVAKMSPHSDNNDNVLWNGGYLKEHSAGQLITFSRRAKLKQDAGQRTTDRNFKTAEKQKFSRCSSHITGANFSCESSSQQCIFEVPVNSSPVLLENCVVPSSLVEAANEMANFKVDDTSDCIAKVCTGLKIKQKFKTSSDSLTAVDTCEEPSKEFFQVQPVDVVKSHCNVPSKSGNNAFSLNVEESGNKLNTCNNNCEKRAIAFLSEERDSSAGINISVAPTSICQMSLETNKKSQDLPENYRDSQSSSTPCCSFVFIDDENDARNKEIEWLESLENILRERKEDRGTCSSMVHDVTDRREGLSSVIPNKSAEQYVQVQDITIDFVNQLSSLSQKKSLTKLPYSSSEEKQKAEKSTPFTDFLGRYLPSNPDIPFDLNSAASSSGSHFRDKVYMLDRKLSYSVNPSLFKHKKITEKATAEMMLSGKRGFLVDEPKRHSSEWSEEELDFLWIGVRRHGVHNWTAILRDPKLQFARSRFPDDLASQWEQEQKKLFNGILFPPTSLSKPIMSSTQLQVGCHAAKAHAFVDNTVCTAETKLSLGDAYLPNENFTINSQFGPAYPHLTGVSSSACPLQGSYLPMSSYPGAVMRHKNSSSSSRTMYQLEYAFNKQFWERLANDSKPAGLPANANLPHWLKEAYGSRPIDIPSAPFFTSGNASGLASNDIALSSTAKHCEPVAASKDLRGRGILKRKSTVSGKNTGILKIDEASQSIDESAVLGIKPSVLSIPIPTPASEQPALVGAGASHQKITTVLPNNISVPVEPNDLVVIDSDASSEETISDDQK